MSEVSRTDELNALQRALLARKLRAGDDPGALLSVEPIAIVGMACRFPGGATTPDAYWQLLKNGVDTVGPAPPGRFDPTLLRQGGIEDPESITGAFLDDVTQFDAEHFRISPREAMLVDPQQRMFLQVCWEALEDSGVSPALLKGSKTGVFVGILGTDYKLMVSHAFDTKTLDPYIASGTDHSFASGRVSYLLGLTGPSISIDTACSSSLVALHSACQSLRDGSSELAVAGGVQLILTPLNLLLGSNPMISADRCRTFDVSASGMTRGEGCGAVVLKRLSDAVADDDEVLAVIRGSAINQDGRSAGLTAPSLSAQKAVLREALTNAGVNAKQIGYVEAHGTATPLGDPIELEALIDVLGEAREDASVCAIGSVKTNIGHLEASAGIAGLIKVVLTLRNQAIPPHLHFDRLNPEVSFEGTPLAISTETHPWPASGSTRFAGLSAFGASGTNVHMVLEEAPRRSVMNKDVGEDARTFILPLSARSEDGIAAQVRRYRDYFASSQECERSELSDICFTAATARTHFDHRVSLLGRTKKEFVEYCDAFLRDDPPPGSSADTVLRGRHRKVVFVFSGQESEWMGMGRDLLSSEPVYRAAIERCDVAIREQVGWSLIEELNADTAHSRLEEIDVSQPAIFAVQYSLAELWCSWGIEPAAVVGQSMGEIAAACVSGALSLEDGARIVCQRSRIGCALRGKGKMAVVHLGFAKARDLISGYEDRVSIAAEQSPESVLLAGEPEALEEILLALEAKEIYCKRLRVDGASHSPLVEPLLPDFLAALDGLSPRPNDIPMVSTVTGDFCDGADLDVHYWARNGRDPVRFFSAFRRLAESGHDLFLEISPHPVTYTAMDSGMRNLGFDGVALYSLRKGADGQATLLETLGRLHTLDLPIDWSGVYRDGHHVHVPTSVWRSSNFWIDEHPGANDGWSASMLNIGRHSIATGHPLIGSPLHLASQPNTVLFSSEIGTDRLPFLSDHRAGDIVALPGSAFLEMAFAAGEECFASTSDAGFYLENLFLEKALILPEGEGRRVQLSVSLDRKEFAAVEIQSAAANEANPTWTRHATAQLRVARAGTDAPQRCDIGSVKAHCSSHWSADEFYAALAEGGQNYGEAFKPVREVWSEPGEAIGFLELDEKTALTVGAYKGLHPVLVDGGFQLVAAALRETVFEEGEGRIFLPIAVGTTRRFAELDSAAWAHVEIDDKQSSQDLVCCNLSFCSDDGEVLLSIESLQLQRLQLGRKQQLADWMFTLQWQPREREIAPTVERDAGVWILLADRAGLADDLRRNLEEHGERCISVRPGSGYRVLGEDCFEVDPTAPQDFVQLLSDIESTGAVNLRGVVHLWSLGCKPNDETSIESLTTDWDLAPVSALNLIQAVSRAARRTEPRLYFVTRGAHAVGDQARVSVTQASVWGVAKVASLEHSDLHVTHLDLDPEPTVDSVVERSEPENVFAELWSDGPETALAFRGETRFGQRLVRHIPQTSRAIATLSSSEVPAFRLQIDQAGIIDQLQLRTVDRPEPPDGMVEIEVCTGSLNFRDVMGVLGVIPALQGTEVLVGGECAGVISAVGPNVKEFSIGDEVVAMTPGIGNYICTFASLVVPKPEHLSMAEAASIPTAFMTADYALNYVGRLRRGERVLIHAASGGVGLAAVAHAQRIGAQIFATAGNPEKRAYLESLGIEHVMDSRSTEFAEQILELTRGAGVDVLLNCLSGDAIEKNFEVLAPYGRYLEIGIRDIYENTKIGLRPFHKNLSYHAIELGPMTAQRPELMRELLVNALRGQSEGVFEALPLTEFPVVEAGEALRFMAQARHIGKVILSLEDQEVEVDPPADGSMTFRENATYLITGGLGGLGLYLSRFMIECGARHLVLTSRSGTDRPVQKEAVEELRRLGAEVVVARADAADELEMTRVFKEMGESMPPLRGVVHCAVVLDDGLLLSQTRESFHRVMAPKVLGAWNLHRLTEDMALDFFALFSSTGALMGSVGQGNYTAANAFLDALANHRRAVGLPGLSINWGPWAEVGGAALLGADDRNAAAGIDSISPEWGAAGFTELLRGTAAQVGFLGLDVQKFFDVHPALLGMPFYEELAGERVGTGGITRAAPVRKKLLAIDSGVERARALRSYLRQQIGSTLRIDPDMIESDKQIFDYGVDSLTAVELRNRLERDLGIEMLSPTVIMLHPTLNTLAPVLARRAGIEWEVEVAPDADPSASSSAAKTAARERGEKIRAAAHRRKRQNPREKNA